MDGRRKEHEAQTVCVDDDSSPEENLNLTIDESWWQNIFSTLRSPYFNITWVLAPVALVVLVCVVLIRQRKSRS